MTFPLAMADCVERRSGKPGWTGPHYLDADDPLRTYCGLEVSTTKKPPKGRGLCCTPCYAKRLRAHPVTDLVC